MCAACPRHSRQRLTLECSQALRAATQLYKIPTSNAMCFHPWSSSKESFLCRSQAAMCKKPTTQQPRPVSQGLTWRQPGRWRLTRHRWTPAAGGHVRQPPSAGWLCLRPVLLLQQTCRHRLLHGKLAAAGYRHGSSPAEATWAPILHEGSCVLADCRPLFCNITGCHGL